MTTAEINNLNWVNLPNKLKVFFKDILTSLTSLGSRVTDLEDNSGGATPQKKAVYYIGGQDNTGLLNVDEKFNNTGIDFEFVREGVGTFSCTQFIQNEHFLNSNIYNSYLSKFYYKPEDSAFYTQTNNIIADDTTFEFGGWIEINIYE